MQTGHKGKSFKRPLAQGSRGVTKYITGRESLAGPLLICGLTLAISCAGGGLGIFWNGVGTSIQRSIDQSRERQANRENKIYNPANAAAILEAWSRHLNE